MTCCNCMGGPLCCRFAPNLADGFNPYSKTSTVGLRDFGSPLIDDPDAAQVALWRAELARINAAPTNEDK